MDLVEADAERKLAVVLIHGIKSSPAMWDPLCKLIKDDPALGFVDVLPFGYATALKRFDPRKAIPSFDTVADSLKEFLDTEAAGYQRVMVTAHSQGGLITQRFLARMLTEGRGADLARIRRVVLLACPNNGSEFFLSLRQRLFVGHPQEKQLRPLNEQIAYTQRTVLRDVVNAKGLTDRSCPIPFSVYAGESDNIVPPASAQSTFPDAAALPGTHSTMVRPDNNRHRTFTTLRRLILATADSDPPAGTTTNRGTPIRSADPLALEVHRVVDPPPGSAGGLPVLTQYVPRDHDRALAAYVAQAVAGTSTMVTLVGGSSTGKTRTCFEALTYLPDDWRLWHPYDPARATAAVEGIKHVSPGTVIWLNEAQFYLHDPAPEVAEAITSALRTVLTDPERAPVLVLGTLWPKYWNALTTRSPGSEPRFTQQQDLLTGLADHIVVPDTFSEADLAALHDRVHQDPRLKLAAQQATGGEITQFLAGAPALMDRYLTAEPAVKAVLQVAMDARRFGHGVALPQKLLTEGAAGYLTPDQYDNLPDDWEQDALDYCSQLCHGARAPLTRMRSSDDQYRLADYLEQQGAKERRTLFPPGSFWEAAVNHTTDLVELARAAEDRGRGRHAVLLYRQAANLDDTRALAELSLHELRRGRHAEAKRLARRAADLGDGTAFEVLGWRLLYSAPNGGDWWRLSQQAADAGRPRSMVLIGRQLAETGRLEEGRRLLRRAAEIDGSEAISWLLAMSPRWRTEADWLRRRAVARGDGSTLAWLARALYPFRDPRLMERIAFQAAEFGVNNALGLVSRLRMQADQWEDATALALRGADHNSNLARCDELRICAMHWADRGRWAEAERLAVHAAGRGDGFALAALAEKRAKAGGWDEAERLTNLAAELGHPFHLGALAGQLAHADRWERAESFADQAAKLGETWGLRALGTIREGAGDQADAARFFRKAAGFGDSEASGRLADILAKSGQWQEAERFALRAANLRGGLHAIDQLRISAGMERVKFGLEPDGSLSEPW
ncbi:MAG: hypothetical protein HOW97_28775 [Catenulispora sp.]|nr:hypothetical protein [Catenulispora sp.]